jgi:hypothetical protein
MRVAFVGGAVAAFALMTAVPAVSAQSRATAHNEPRVGSPAGVIYQIPLDNARRDAAPVLSVGSHGGPGSNGGAGSPTSIHSENGFGSSSHVPGVSAAALRVGGPDGQAPGSSFPTFLLIVLIAAAAIIAGVLVRGARRRSSGGAGEHPPDL